MRVAWSHTPGTGLGTIRTPAVDGGSRVRTPRPIQDLVPDELDELREGPRAVPLTPGS